jgi:hypothetical protein
MTHGQSNLTIIDEKEIFRLAHTLDPSAFPGADTNVTVFLLPTLRHVGASGI